MRLDFEPHPYGGPSDDSNDSADSNASDVSSDDSNASGPPGRKRGPRQKTSQFQAVVLALREAARARRDYESKKPEFDSFTYLEDVCLGEEEKREQREREREFSFANLLFFSSSFMTKRRTR